MVDYLFDGMPAVSGLVADFGCGLGATTRRLQERRPHCRPIAVNFSIAQLQQVRLRLPRAMLLQSDAARLALADACLDSILSVEAALHFQTREAFVAEAARTLRPGGHIALSDILFAPTGWPGSWTVPEENYLPSLAAYQAMFEKVGFVDIRIEDTLTDSWHPFCHTLGAYMERAAKTPLEVEQARDFVMASIRGTTHYVLLWARKPG